MSERLEKLLDLTSYLGMELNPKEETIGSKNNKINALLLYDSGEIKYYTDDNVKMVYIDGIDMSYHVRSISHLAKTIKSVYKDK